MSPLELRVPALLALVTALALAGCDNESAGGGEPPPETPDPAEILSFGAEPATIAPGGTAVLSWRTSAAVSLTLSPEGGEPLDLAGADLADGQLEVKPEETTTYVLVATGAEGSGTPAEARTTVTVEAVVIPAPTIESFAAEPAAIAEGEETTLSWRTADATVIAIRASDGSPVQVGDASPDAGSVTIRPDADATYTLIARSAGGEVTATTSVTVAPKPRVTRLSASPAGVVELGTEVTLSWAVADASRVVITDAGGATLADVADALEGTVAVTPDFASVYTLTATGPGGEATASVQVPVAPIIDSFSLAPAIVRTGDPVDLAWSIRGADAARLDGPGGFTRALAGAELAGGTLSVPVPASGDFVLTATRQSVARSWSIFAETTDAPRVRTFTATPSDLTASQSEPGTVTLTWVADGATSLEILATPGGPVDTSAVPPEGGSVDVAVGFDTTFRLVASNDAGSHGATAQVTTALPPGIDSFVGGPPRLAPGETATFTWETHVAVAVRLVRDGVDLVVDPALVDGGTTDAPLVDSTYVLYAQNRLGAEVASAPVTIAAGPPGIASFAADPTDTTVGTPITFTWTTEAAVLVEVLEPGGAVACSTADPVEVAGGSCVAVVVPTGGTHTYTLRVVNSAGQESFATVDVFATDGPVIHSFTASAATVTVGGSVELSWAVADDPQGVVPTLALVDQNGTSYDLSALDPHAGTIDVALPTDEQWTFTLTATTPGRIADTAQVTVEVIRLAELLSFAVTPTEVDTQGGTVQPPVELAWTTLNGSRVELVALDAGGNEVLPALVDSVDPAVIDAGTFQTTVSATTVFRLRLSNRVGDFVLAEARVVADPVAIGSFTATPEDIILGESTTLAWTTANATGVSLSPDDPEITEIVAPYLDVSASPTALSANFTSSSDNSGVVFTFPQGFSFPYGGATYTQARLNTNGYLSLDVATSTNSSTNSTLPSTANDHVHFAPFWDDLHAKSTGQAYWDVQSDASGTFLVVQWKNFQFASNTAAIPGDLNFEIILRADGNVEYRYGTMTSSGATATTDQARADGSSATIGLQAFDGSRGTLISFNTAYPGGASNRAVSFELFEAPSGSRDIRPLASTTYTLTAVNADGTTSRTVDVRVHPVAAFTMSTAVPAQPELGSTYRIAWQTGGGTELVVSDAGGAVVCTVTSPAAVAVGSCDVPATALGPTTYALTLTSGMVRNQAVAAVPVTVVPVLRIDGFSAAPPDIAAGGSTTISWAATGSAVTTLYEGATPIDVSAQPANGGSVSVSPAGTTTYQLVVDDGFGRTRTATLVVRVDAPVIDSLTAVTEQIPMGGTATISWETTGGASVSSNAYSPLTEPSLPFLDISGSPTATLVAFSSADEGLTAFTFPAGFTFPFDGAAQTQAKVSTNGWLSFDMANTSANLSNNAIPTSATYSEVNLPVFWDDLDANTTGEVWYDVGSDAEGNYLVVQWKAFEFFASTAANPGNLNFEIVLRDNGAFEYRYGTMVQAPASATTDQERADGDAATIGYQNAGRTEYFQVRHNTAAVGGQSNRAYRFDPAVPIDGTAVVTPSQSTTYEVCATSANGTTACREVRVVVVVPGSVTISELMIAPGAGLADADAEWIELRNTTPDRLDLSGWVLGSMGDAGFTIPEGTMVGPGEVITIAGSGDPLVNGGLVPDLVWSGVSLLDASDDVTLHYGALLVDAVAWDATWSVTPGQSLSLDPSHFRGDAAANDAFAAWCPSVEPLGVGSGSPGTVGTGCLLPVYDMDPAVSADAWIDIAATGTPLGATFGQVPGGIGFVMPFFDSEVSDLWITQSGMVAFAPVTSSHTGNDAFPSSTTPDGGVVGAFWDNLVTQAGSSVVWEPRVVGGRRAMIVQWTNLRQTTSTAGTNTFQLQLFEDGEILVIIREAEGTDMDLSTGSSASSGLEDLDQIRAIQFSNDETVLTAGRAIRYTRR